MSEPTTEPGGPVCPVCGSPVASQPGRGQPRRYCSSACKSRAARQRRVERALSPTPSTAPAADRWEIAERVRITRALTREAAIEKVAGDPDALNTALIRARTLLASPTHRATRWGEVAATITALATTIGDDVTRKFLPQG